MCHIAVDSYDLDPVRYRSHWYRDGAYYSAASNRPVVPATQTVTIGGGISVPIDDQRE